jgi:hypothetical protein
MSLTQIIVLHWLAIIAMALVILYLYNRVQFWKRPARRHIVINNVEPLKVQFEHEFEPVNPNWMAESEAEWHRRRTVATSFSDYVFKELMKPDSELLQIAETTPSYSRNPARVTAYMYFVPIKK